MADVDGDGKREIAFENTGVKIYKNGGDDAWYEIWSDPANIRSIGAGDHDGDGKDEV